MRKRAQNARNGTIWIASYLDAPPVSATKAARRLRTTQPGTGEPPDFFVRRTGTRPLSMHCCPSRLTRIARLRDRQRLAEVAERLAHLAIHRLTLLTQRPQPVYLSITRLHWICQPEAWLKTALNFTDQRMPDACDIAYRKGRDKGCRLPRKSELTSNGILASIR